MSHGLLKCRVIFFYHFPISECTSDLKTLTHFKRPFLLVTSQYKKSSRSQSYQTFIFPVFWFLLLSLKVCSIWIKCVYCTTAKLSSEKLKNSSFTKKKSLAGLPPECFFNLLTLSCCVGFIGVEPIFAIDSAVPKNVAYLWRGENLS